VKLRHLSILFWLVLLVGVFSTGIFAGDGLAGIIAISPRIQPTPIHPDLGPQPFPDAYKLQHKELPNIVVPGNNPSIPPHPCGGMASQPWFSGVSPLSIAYVPNNCVWGYGDIAVWQAGGHNYVAQSGFDGTKMYYLWNVDDAYNPVLLFSKPFPTGGSASTAVFHFHQFGHEYVATTMRGTGQGCGYFIDNVDNPGSPVVVVTNFHNGTNWCTPHETFVSTDANGDADYAWLTMSAESGSGIKIVALTLPDLSQSNVLTQTGSYQRPDSVGFTHDSNVVGNRVYVGHWDGGAIVFDKETLAHNVNPTPLNPINSIRPTPFGSFWVHHMVPTTDNKFLIIEDEFLNQPTTEKLKIYNIENIASPVYVSGVIGGDPNSNISQAHNQIIKNLGPHHDLLLSAWYKAGYRLYDLDTSGSTPVVTQVGGHQLRPTGAPDFDGVWGVDSLPCTVRGFQTTCLYSSDLTYGLIVDALGVNNALDPYAPDPSVITSPTNGQEITTCTFTITGTAPADYWSGLDRIELSFDNGATWQAATGTTNWSYEWNVSGSGPQTIQVRSVDMAGNTQLTPTQVTVNVTASCGANTATPVPPTPLPPTSTPPQGCFGPGGSPLCTPTMPVLTATPTTPPSNTSTATVHTPTPTNTPFCPGCCASPLCTPTVPVQSTTPTSTPPTPGGCFGPGGAPLCTPTVCPVVFTDVPVGSTFYTFIRCLACRGILSGYPDNTFRPNNNITRGQLSKIVSNSAGFSDPQAAPMFQDVPSGSTFFDFVGRLASRGYIGGYPCGGPGETCVPPGNLPYFRPNANATRGQIAKIVSNTAGFNEPATGQAFEDVAPASTFYDFVERLALRDVMSGYPCGGPTEPCQPPENRPYFRPNINATRGQSSKIIVNTFFPSCVTPGP
jgi:hypothetical protein